MHIPGLSPLANSMYTAAIGSQESQSLVKRDFGDNCIAGFRSNATNADGKHTYYITENFEGSFCGIYRDFVERNCRDLTSVSDYLAQQTLDDKNSDAGLVRHLLTDTNGFWHYPDIGQLTRFGPGNETLDKCVADSYNNAVDTFKHTSEYTKEVVLPAFGLAVLVAVGVVWAYRKWSSNHQGTNANANAQQAPRSWQIRNPLRNRTTETQSTSIELERLTTNVDGNDSPPPYDQHEQGNDLPPPYTGHDNNDENPPLPTTTPADPGATS